MNLSKTLATKRGKVIAIVVVGALAALVMRARKGTAAAAPAPAAIDTTAAPAASAATPFDYSGSLPGMGGSTPGGYDYLQTQPPLTGGYNPTNAPVPTGAAGDPVQTQDQQLESTNALLGQLVTSSSHKPTGVGKPPKPKKPKPHPAAPHKKPPTKPFKPATVAHKPIIKPKPAGSTWPKPAPRPKPLPKR